MYPTLCRFRADPAHDDPVLAMVATDFGLGDWRPSLALRALDGQVEVLISIDGRTAMVPSAEALVGLDDAVALGLMDALEEAIEDACEDEAGDPALATRLEATLSLLERCFGDESERL